MPEISRTDVLSITPKISKTNMLIIQHLQEPFRPATVLKIWPAIGRDRRHVETVPFA